MKLRIKRFPDNCYAVIRGNRRGPVGPDRRRAVERYRKSGLIAYAGSDRPQFGKCGALVKGHCCRFESTCLAANNLWLCTFHYNRQKI